jgi:hypothetical protein
MRKEFYLHKRPRKSGKPVYCVQFPGENGTRTTEISTGQTSKTAAELWARDFLRKGGLPTQGRVTFGRFAEKGWIYDECPYIKGRIAGGFHISRGYARVGRSYLERYVVPRFGNSALPKSPRPITANLLAAPTGMRLGEGQRLQIRHFQPGWVVAVHSWRHGFNTMIRGKVPNEQLRRVTRHKTLAKTRLDRFVLSANHLIASSRVEESAK